MIDMDHPHLMTPEEREHLAKVWESCKTKFTNAPKFGTLIFFGTAGEEDSKKLRDLFYAPEDYKIIDDEK